MRSEYGNGLFTVNRGAVGALWPTPFADAKDLKPDGFPNEQYFIVPTEAFVDYAAHPLIRGMYLTDVGYFPCAQRHYREREEGADEHILLYCVAGTGRVELEDAAYTLCADELFCIEPGRRHRYYADESDPWSIFWVHFKGEEVRHFPLGGGQIVRMLSSHAQNRLVFLFDLLFRVLERNYTLGNFIYISAVLKMILAEVYYREKRDEVSPQNRHVTNITRYMYAHLSQPLTLEELVREFGLSRSYINAMFRSCTGRTPIDFFIHLKMQEACKLLKASDMRVGEVARALGYMDAYYFSRIFKKSVGVAPSEYRSAELILY